MRSFWLIFSIICLVQINVSVVLGKEVKYKYNDVERVVKKSERTSIVETEFGSISTVDISDGSGIDEYHIQFITLEDNALFLPVLLHANVIFYVHSGSGSLSWTDGEKSEKKSKKMNKITLRRGDLYPLRAGALFYINSNSSDADAVISRLSITAVFTNPDDDEHLSGPFVGPYTSINELVRGFDKPVLQAAFQVPEEVIEELTNGEDTAAIVRADQQQADQRAWEEEMLIDVIFGIQRFSNRADENKKKKKRKKHTTETTFNFFEEAPDFENCYGSSKVVTKRDLKALRDSQIGVYMVNLTKGSMMGPHWNTAATEVSVVLEGEGMVQVVCPSSLTNKDCKSTRVRVEEGDVFTVPRYHPTAQVSFNNGSLVFLGFSTTPSEKNRPQLLAGKGSVLETLDEHILGLSFNVSNTTVGQLLASKNESFMLDCTSCAETMIEGERPDEEDIERKEEDEQQRRLEGEEEDGEKETDEEMIERQREEEEADTRWGNTKVDYRRQKR